MRGIRRPLLGNSDRGAPACGAAVVWLWGVATFGRGGLSSAWCARGGRRRRPRGWAEGRSAAGVAWAAAVAAQRAGVERGAGGAAAGEAPPLPARRSLRSPSRLPTSTTASAVTPPVSPKSVRICPAGGGGDAEVAGHTRQDRAELQEARLRGKHADQRDGRDVPPLPLGTRSARPPGTNWSSTAHASQRPLTSAVPRPPRQRCRDSSVAAAVGSKGSGMQTPPFRRKR
jgi:hypothetical protein